MPKITVGLGDGDRVELDAEVLVQPGLKVAVVESGERYAALMKMRELWKKHRPDPVDGVEYQNAMRAEWR